jgi:hypothetical protein
LNGHGETTATMILPGALRGYLVPPVPSLGRKASKARRALRRFSVAAICLACRIS